MRHLADDIVFSVKDAMRNLRYVIRDEARRSLPGEAEGGVSPRRAHARLGRRRGEVAGLVDQVFTGVESGVLAMVSPSRAIQGVPLLRPVRDYFGDGIAGEAASRAFARAHYHAAKAMMHRCGARNVLILEHVIARTRDEIVRRDAEHVAAARTATASPAERVRLCSAIARRLIEARPIREADPRGSTLASQAIAERPNAYCFATIGLATAIVSVHDATVLPEPADIIEGAASVAEVRFDRFLTALDAADPVEALALEFESLLPVLA